MDAGQEGTHLVRRDAGLGERRRRVAQLVERVLDLVEQRLELLCEDLELRAARGEGGTRADGGRVGGQAHAREVGRRRPEGGPREAGRSRADGRTCCWLLALDTGRSCHVSSVSPRSAAVSTGPSSASASSSTSAGAGAACGGGEAAAPTRTTSSMGTGSELRRLMAGLALALTGAALRAG